MAVVVPEEVTSNPSSIQVSRMKSPSAGYTFLSFEGQDRFNPILLFLLKGLREVTSEVKPSQGQIIQKNFPIKSTTKISSAHHQVQVRTGAILCLWFAKSPARMITRNKEIDNS